MKVSLNTIKQYIDFELPPVDELVKRINEQLGGVENVTDLSAKYKDVVIVKVVECEQHPNADRLHVCKVDDGGVVADVPRDENGLVQVVCGAPNVHAGMFAAWLPPKSTVPASFDNAEPFVLSARELRGVLSQGMMAAGDELAISSDHDGIVEIKPDEWKPNDAEIKPGASFAQAFGLDDTLIDIENKMFTHRPDLFGQLGVAREIAGILGYKFTSPDWYLNQPEFQSESGLALEVFNDVQDKVPRFMAVAIKGVEVKPSPLWMQIELLRLGGKSINNIVDVTNYVMLLTAQPTHAYDYDKIRGHKVGARMAHEGEKALLLNGKTYELGPDDIVIADGEGVIGLAGIMGGGNSEVSNETKNIVLEVASFDMYAVRKSSMRHGVFTDALTRFNKGQSPLQNDRVINLLMMSIRDVAGGEQASEMFDAKDEELQMKAPLGNVVYGNNQTPKTMFEWGSYSTVIAIDENFVSSRLGLDMSAQEIETILQNVELKAHAGDHPDHPEEIEVIAPFWRTDIELPEDIVEEVGRLYGFDKMPRELPRRSMKPAAKSLARETKQALRDALSRSGANEVLTYSFVHENVLKNAGQNPEKAFRLGNALSPDLQYYRLSVLPSLLDKIHMNIRAGFGEFAIFELGKGHHKDEFDEEELPREFGRLAGVYAGKQAADGAAYFQAKRLFEECAREFGFAGTVRYQKLSEFDFGDHDMLKQMAAPFDPERSAMIWFDEKHFGGIVGEFKASVAKAFKLPARAAGFELFLSMFEKALGAKQRNYRPLSKFPSVTQDVSLKVARDVSYGDLAELVTAAVREQAGTLDTTVSPVTIYQSADDSSTRTITYRLVATSYDKTLRDSDVSPLIDHAAAKALEKFGAELA